MSDCFDCRVFPLNIAFVVLWTSFAADSARLSRCWTESKKIESSLVQGSPRVQSCLCTASRLLLSIHAIRGGGVASSWAGLSKTRWPLSNAPQGTRRSPLQCTELRHSAAHRGWRRGARVPRSMSSLTLIVNSAASSTKVASLALAVEARSPAPLLLCSSAPLLLSPLLLLFFIFRTPDFRYRANSVTQSHTVRVLVREFSELSDAGVERRRCARRHDGGSCLHPFQPVSRERWATSTRRRGDACGVSPAVSRV